MPSTSGVDGRNQRLIHHLRTGDTSHALHRGRVAAAMAALAGSVVTQVSPMVVTIRQFT
jgi:hypothetical protein